MPPYTSPVAALLASLNRVEQEPYLLGHPEAVEAYLEGQFDHLRLRPVYKPLELVERAQRRDLSLETRQRLVESAITYGVDSEVTELSLLVTDLLRRELIQPSTVVVRLLQEQIRSCGEPDLEIIRAGLGTKSLIENAGWTGDWVSSLAVAHLAAQHPGAYPLLPRQLVQDIANMWPAVQTAWRKAWTDLDTERVEAADLDGNTPDAPIIDLRVLTADTPWDMDRATAIPPERTREEPWLAPANTRDPQRILDALDNPEGVVYRPDFDGMAPINDHYAHQYLRSHSRVVDHGDHIYSDLTRRLLTGGTIAHDTQRALQLSAAPLSEEAQFALYEGLIGARAARPTHDLVSIATEHWIQFPAVSSLSLIRGILHAKARFKSTHIDWSLPTVLPCTPETAALWWEFALAIAVQDQSVIFEMWLRHFLQAQTAQLAAQGQDATHCRVPPIGVWEHYGHQLAAGPRALLLRDAPHLARVEPPARARGPVGRRGR